MELGESPSDLHDNPSESLDDSATDTSLHGENGNSASLEKQPYTRLTFELLSGEHIRITIECIDGQNGSAVPVAAFDVLPSGEVKSHSAIGAAPVALIAEGALPAQAGSRSSRLRLAWRSAVIILPTILFALSLLVYFSTRVIGLARFPIYFFTDEAVQTMLAADLVRDNFVAEIRSYCPPILRTGIITTWAPACICRSCRICFSANQCSSPAWSRC